MRLAEVHRVFFIGIGGIGMSALARWFMHYHKPVAGYDKTQTPLTLKLEQEGADLHYIDDMSGVHKDFLNDKEHTLIIYTPAIPVGHSELEYFQSSGFTVMKRSEVLGMISDDMYTIAVAGTHGKTTTSSMIAHSLKEGGVSFTALIGGVMSNYDSNLVVNGKEPKILVVEADEFDRSFLQLKPDIAVITSMDADHLDVYGHEGELHNSFRQFVGKISSEGKLFYHHSLSSSIADFGFEKAYSYGGQDADIVANILRIEDGRTLVNISRDDQSFDVSLSLPGRYNVDNAAVASIAAIETGVHPDKVQTSFLTYKGVKRRFEYILKKGNFVLIDDYAHHPTEISAFIGGVKSIYPNYKISVIFQPHLYSRTRDFAQGFAKSLSLADQVILLDIYPARELPMTGVSSEIIFEEITSRDKIMCNKEEIMQVIEHMEFEVLCTIGAGDIDQIVIPLRDHLNKEMA